MGLMVSIIPDLLIARSKIHGQGVFSGHHINCGDVVLANLVGTQYEALLNHSCDPSAAIIWKGEVGLVRALRPMSSLTEITVDYSLVYPDPGGMPCVCEAAACRKTIGAYSTLPPEVRKKYEYLKIVPEYLSRPS